MLSFIGFFFVLPCVLSQKGFDFCLEVVCPVGFVCNRGACIPYVHRSPDSISSSIPDVCESNPCVNNCECVPSCMHEEGYYCKSSAGFIGKNCNIEIPQLNCSADRITISVASAFFDELYPSGDGAGCLYIGESVGEPESGNGGCEVCFSVDGYYTASLALPFTQCGGSINTTGGMVSFSNLVWAGLNQALTYDIPVPVLRFQCTYNQEYTIFTSLVPTVEDWRIAVNDTMKLHAGVELCKIGNACPDACPPLYSVQAGTTYTVAETIHAILSVQSSYLTDTSNAVMLENLHLSCNKIYSDVLASGDVSLVSGGCENSVLTTSINRRRSNEKVVCVSFKVPRLLRCQDSLFYIHAKLRIVDTLPICRFPRNLFKRSIEEDEDKTVVMVIPIRMIEGSEGFEDSEVFPAMDLRSSRILESRKIATDATLHRNGTPDGLIIGAIILGCLLVCIIVLALFTYYLRA